MFAVRLARELYAPCEVPIAIASASTLVARNEIDGLIRIGQQLIVADLALRRHGRLLFTAANARASRARQLTFHRGADPVRHVLDHPAGDVDVILVAPAVLASAFSEPSS